MIIKKVRRAHQNKRYQELRSKISSSLRPRSKSVRLCLLQRREHQSPPVNARNTKRLLLPFILSTYSTDAKTSQNRGAVPGNSQSKAARVTTLISSLAWASRNGFARTVHSSSAKPVSKSTRTSSTKRAAPAIVIDLHAFNLFF